MKRILVMVSVAALVALGSASTALAVTNYTKTISGTTTSSIGSTPFKVSTAVVMMVAGNEGGYNVADKHKSGDKTYLSSSVSASIDEFDSVKGVDLTAIPTATNAADIYSGGQSGY